MSLSQILIKIGGVVLFIVGIALLLSTVGISLFGVHLGNWIESAIVGVLFVAGGVVLIRGGNITL